MQEPLAGPPGAMAPLGTLPPRQVATIALVALLAVAAATGGLRTARSAWRSGRRPRAWHVGGGLLVAFPLIVSAAAAAELGVALLTVALVGGQTVGSVLLDRTGLAPGGVRPMTRRRAAGAGLAVLAVALVALEDGGELDALLLAASVLAGAAIAVIQAATGHLAEAFDDAVTGSAALFAGALVTTTAAWLAATGGTAPGGWDAPPQDLLAGGLLGVLITVAIGVVVPRLGSLGLTVALTAGQSLGALLLDAVAPAGDTRIGAVTVLSLGLVFVAVVVTGTGSGERAPGSALRDAPLSAPRSGRAAVPRAGGGARSRRAR